MSDTGTTRRRGNHEGSAPLRRADGRWQASIRYTDDQGVGRRVLVGGKTAAEVRAKLREVQDRIKAGQPARDATVTVGAFAVEWIASTLAASERKPSTKEGYATLARVHIIGRTIGATPLARLRPTRIEGWLVELRGAGYAPSTVRSTYAVLRAILDTAVRDGLVARNVAQAIPRPKVSPHEAVYLSPAEVRTLLDAAEGSRYRGALVLLAHTGLRRGEALALRWVDVDLDAGTLHVRGTLARVGGSLTVTEPKTAKSRRIIPIDPAVDHVLREARQRQREERLAAGNQWHASGHVFTTETGTPVDPRNLLRTVTVAARRAGLPGVSLHTLRHSAASAMLSAGVPLKVVSDLLGHASVAITGDVYGHVLPGVSRDAIATLGKALAE